MSKILQFVYFFKIYAFAKTQVKFLDIHVALKVYQVASVKFRVGFAQIQVDSALLQVAYVEMQVA